MLMRISTERIVFLAGLGVALLFFWQSVGLDAWSILGPGPGLFPRVITGFSSVVAALLVAFPGLAKNTAAATSETEAEPEPGPEERRIFRIYCLAMPFLAIGSAYLGFILMSLILVMALTWFAERRSWRRALVYGVLCGLVGVIGFGQFLGASVPAAELDRVILRFLH